MAYTWPKRIGLAAAALAVVGATVWALSPKPVAVDLAEIDTGPLEVTIEEEGVTRIRDVYQVFAPIGGQIDRSALEVGDAVTRGETVIALIHPGDPAFLDTRTQAELEAAAEAANAAVSLAEAEVARAQAQLGLARSELDRSEQLLERRIISPKAYELAAADVDIREAQLTQALATLNIRQSERASARARLIQPGRSGRDETDETCCIRVLAPESGVTLAVPAKSARVVTAGTLLAEIGDPDNLEVVVDLLSEDAVRISPGTKARLINWGGAGELTARVRRIDPVGFTKVSALGIEEQRVNAVLDFTAPVEAYARLGHDFRVFVQVLVEDIAETTRLPLGALFRSGETWAVFRVADGTARLTPVTLGARSAQHAEVREGLQPGDTVIIHPSDSIADGVAVMPREES